MNTYINYTVANLKWVVVPRVIKVLRGMVAFWLGVKIPFYWIATRFGYPKLNGERGISAYMEPYNWLWCIPVQVVFDDHKIVYVISTKKLHRQVAENEVIWSEEVWGQFKPFLKAAEDYQAQRDGKGVEGVVS